MDKFHLNKAFVNQFKGLQPNWGPLGYVTYKRTYARPIEDENRHEEWYETLERVVNGVYTIQLQHVAKYNLAWDARKAQKSAQRMFQLMWDFKFLPPGRGLQMMGTPLVEARGNAALQNCAFVSTKHLAEDFSAPFCFMMDMSMLGVGVGADTKGTGEVFVQECERSDETYIIPDTREGWIEVLRLVLDSYTHGGPLPVLDYSQIRPYGALIKGFGGTASGPAPLAELVLNIQSILDPLVGHPITTAAIVDIFNAIGRCVISGNVRRSAQIMFADADNEEFLKLKDPTINATKLMKWRWASNNSVFAKVGADYSKVLEMTAKNGEPGFLWLDNARKFGRMDGNVNNVDYRVEGTNPCGEISLESYEFCTLVETFPANHETLADWVNTLQYAYLYAKTVTLLTSHDQRSNAVMLRNRRIGVSISGIAQTIQKFGMGNFAFNLDSGYNRLKRLDCKYSEWFCIPQSIKLTTVKPSGTVSLLTGATPGIHFPYAQYYWRTIRFDRTSPLVETLRAAGYKVVDGEGLNTVIVYFPVQETNFDRSAGDVSIWEQLELAALLQSHWADNQVSVTVNFQENEKSSLKRALEMYDRRLKSVSFLPYSNHSYEHAPYQPITKEVYDEAVRQLKPISAVFGVESQTPVLYCDSDKCMVV